MFHLSLLYSLGGSSPYYSAGITLFNFLNAGSYLYVLSCIVVCNPQQKGLQIAPTPSQLPTLLRELTVGNRKVKRKGGRENIPAFNQLRNRRDGERTSIN